MRKQGPGEDGERPALRQRGEAGDEVCAVRVIPEDGAPLEPPHHYVVEGVRGIQAGLTGHGAEYASNI